MKIYKSEPSQAAFSSVLSRERDPSTCEHLSGNFRADRSVSSLGAPGWGRRAVLTIWAVASSSGTVCGAVSRWHGRGGAGGSMSCAGWLLDASQTGGAAENRTSVRSAGNTHRGAPGLPADVRGERLRGRLSRPAPAPKYRPGLQVRDGRSYLTFCVPSWLSAACAWRVLPLPCTRSTAPLWALVVGTSLCTPSGGWM